MHHAILALVLAGCAHNAPPAVPAPTTVMVTAYDPAAIVAATDRTDADRALDEGRDPAEMLRFYGVVPGMRIGEMFAGGGYSAELFARAVGPAGAVYGVNSPEMLERFAEGPWAERLAKPVNANVHRIDAPFDAPFPGMNDELDVVFSILVYHDFFWQEVDRAAMNRAIFTALKPGGVYAVIDHSAAEGSGDAHVQTLHRGDEALIRAEIEAAGFELVDTSDFLRNPDDTRDWSASPRAAGERRGTSDRFALKFRKPG